MSHQVMVKTQMKDKEALEQTLTELGYSFSEGGRLTGYYGKDQGEVDYSVTVGGKSGSVGFRFDKSDETYNVVGDFYGLQISEQNFRNSVKKTYVGKKLETLLGKKRYTIVNKKTAKNGAIKIRARSMVA